jgi:hypothetical protein
MRAEEIKAALQELASDKEIEILQETDDGILVYDLEYGKEIAYNLNMTVEKLIDKIYINPSIPKYCMPDKKKVAEYLIKHLPVDAFYTLNKICFVYGEEADCETLAQFFDEDVDWAREVILSDNLGKMWFEYNSVLIDVKNIIESAEQIAREDRAMGWPSSERTDTMRQIAITLIHELRHLMLDTNIVLSEEEYPVNLSAEESVEHFAVRTIGMYGHNIFTERGYNIADIIPCV